MNDLKMNIQILIHSEPLTNAGITILESFDLQHRGVQELISGLFKNKKCEFSLPYLDSEQKLYKSYK